MTRQQFIDDVTCFYDLKEFCDENGFDICEDIYDSDDIDGLIEDDIRETLRNDGWRELRDAMSYLNFGDYDWYRRDGGFDYIPLDDDDFEDYKGRALDMGDGDEVWDEEEEDDEPEHTPDPEHVDMFPEIEFLLECSA